MSRLVFEFIYIIGSQMNYYHNLILLFNVGSSLDHSVWRFLELPNRKPTRLANYDYSNVYRVEEKDIINILSSLKNEIKHTWYIHAFSNDKLFVVLRGKVFELSPCKDSSWDEMIKYGFEVAKVEKYFLENMSLHV